MPFFGPTWKRTKEEGEGVAGVLRARGTRGLRRPSFDARGEPHPQRPHWKGQTTEQVGLNGDGFSDLPARRDRTIRMSSLDARSKGQPRPLLCRALEKIGIRSLDVGTV